MQQSSWGGSRLARGSSAAVFATFAALVAHVAAGGAAPDPIGLLPPLIAAVVVSVWISGRNLSLVRLSLAAVASQVLFHVLFVLGAGGAGGAHEAGHAAHMSGAMMGAHVLAAVATVVFLHRGERAIHHLRALSERLATWVRRRIAGPIVVPALPRPARVASRSAVRPLYSRVAKSVQPHRGPPRGIRSLTIAL